MIILVSILIVLFLLVLTTVIVNFTDYKHYKYNYLLLKDGFLEFNYEFGGQYYFKLKGDSRRFNLLQELIFFNGKDVKLLGEGIYLHNDTNSYFDPYAFYWLKKYQKWFKQNKNNFINPKEYQF